MFRVLFLIINPDGTCIDYFHTIRYQGVLGAIIANSGKQAVDIGIFTIAFGIQMIDTQSGAARRILIRTVSIPRSEIRTGNFHDDNIIARRFCNRHGIQIRINAAVLR